MIRFHRRSGQDKKIAEALRQSLRCSMNFKINSKSYQFSYIIKDVHELLDMDYGVTKEEFKDCIRSHILQIHDFY